jgi:hypothetical protein
MVVVVVKMAEAIETVALMVKTVEMMVNAVAMLRMVVMAEVT